MGAPSGFASCSYPRRRDIVYSGRTVAIEIQDCPSLWHSKNDDRNIGQGSAVLRIAVTRRRIERETLYMHFCIEDGDDASGADVVVSQAITGDCSEYAVHAIQKKQRQLHVLLVAANDSLYIQLCTAGNPGRGEELVAVRGSLEAII